MHTIAAVVGMVERRSQDQRGSHALTDHDDAFDALGEARPGDTPRRSDHAAQSVASMSVDGGAVAGQPWQLDVVTGAGHRLGDPAHETPGCR